jgi:hypothetical protein
MTIKLKNALQIVSKLLNDYLNDPDVHITEEEEEAVILIMTLAKENKNMTYEIKASKFISLN